MGQTEEEQATIDCISENVRDIKERWSKLKQQPSASEEEKQKAVDQWFSPTGEFSDLLLKLEKSLPPAPPGSPPHFSVGGQLSYADVCVWSLVEDCFLSAREREGAERGVRGTGGRLGDIAKYVAQLPALKQYLASRPPSLF
jgi:hypothetical protein